MTWTSSWTVFALSVAIGCEGLHAQTPIPPFPQDFLMAAVQSDQYEIMAAHLALVQGHDPRVGIFAKEMVQDHMRLTENLRKAAIASGLPLPGSGMSSDQAALLSGLQGLRGTEFDKAYARQQELEHAQAVAVSDSFATQGADVNLKRVAQSSLPVIEEHFKKAQQLSIDVGGS